MKDRFFNGAIGQQNTILVESTACARGHKNT